MEQNICDVLINNNEEWREKNYKTISLLYGKAPFIMNIKIFWMIYIRGTGKN